MVRRIHEVNVRGNFVGGFEVNQRVKGVSVLAVRLRPRLQRHDYEEGFGILPHSLYLQVCMGGGPMVVGG